MNILLFSNIFIYFTKITIFEKQKKYFFYNFLNFNNWPFKNNFVKLSAFVSYWQKDIFITQNAQKHQ